LWFTGMRGLLETNTSPCLALPVTLRCSSTYSHSHAHTGVCTRARPVGGCVCACDTPSVQPRPCSAPVSCLVALPCCVALLRCLVALLLRVALPLPLLLPFFCRYVAVLLPLRHDALRCVALRCVARCVALRCVALRCVALRCVALRCVALRCVALRCVCICICAAPPRTDARVLARIAVIVVHVPTSTSLANTRLFARRRRIHTRAVSNTWWMRYFAATSLQASLHLARVVCGMPGTTADVTLFYLQVLRLSFPLLLASTSVPSLPRSDH
jgi:hypothetical protein